MRQDRAGPERKKIVADRLALALVLAVSHAGSELAVPRE